jgi:hypothetical protein
MQSGSHLEARKLGVIIENRTRNVSIRAGHRSEDDVHITFGWNQAETAVRAGTDLVLVIWS